MADTRACDQCGTSFTPRREHARFCSARCRVAWNRQTARDLRTEASALDWSVIAMRDAAERICRARASGGPQAFAIISEAVWWVTIVDATLVRHHPETYNAVLASQADEERALIEGTLAGLRFVRNRMGYHADPADFIQPRSARSRPITTWTWRSVPEPALASLPPRGQEWEMARYRAYQVRLRGHTIGETFSRAAAFLRLASGQAAGEQPASERPAGVRSAEGRG